MAAGLLQRGGGCHVKEKPADGTWTLSLSAHDVAGNKATVALGTVQVATLIDAVRTALVLAPHTDDGEFGCGGTMARLVEQGVDVRQIAFSTASRSLPPGFAPDTLAHESRAASQRSGSPRTR